MVFAQSNKENYLTYSKQVAVGNVDIPLEQFSIRYYQGGSKSFAFKLFNKVRGVKETPLFCSKDSFPIVYSCVHDGMVNYEEKMNVNYEVNYKTIAGEKLLENPAEYSSAIKNNIIIIGHLGKNQFDMEDKFPVPTDTIDVVNRVPLMPGPVIHANALSNMLDNQYFKMPSAWLSFLLSNFIMLILIFFIIQHPLKIFLIAGLVIISIIWIWLSIYLMEFKIYIQVGSTLVGLLILEEFIEVFDPFVVKWYAKIKNSLLKNKKSLVLFNLFLFTLFNFQAQSIYVKVKKGSAKLNGISFSSKDAVKTIASNTKLMVMAQSIVVIKQNKVHYF
jgi:hypothetical protein